MPGPVSESYEGPGDDWDEFEKPFNYGICQLCDCPLFSEEEMYKVCKRCRPELQAFHPIDDQPRRPR